MREYSYELHIFNRWGQLIFYTNDYELGWNGTMLGNSSEVVAQGVYVYVIKLQLKSDLFSKGKKYTGSINLLR